MKSKLLFLLKYYLFWILLSVVARIIFLFYQWHDTLTLAGSDIWHIFAGGLRLDLSLGGYVMMLACAILAFSPFVSVKKIRKLFAWLTCIFIIYFSIVMTVDLELFRNWGYHIDTTPLLYLKNPKEAMASTPLWLIICLLLLIFVFAFFAYLFFRRFILKGLEYQKKKYWQIPVFLLFGGAMIIPVRGGFNVGTMNSSFVFFNHQNMYANQAGINPVWNFTNELVYIKRQKSQYYFMPEEEAERLIRETEETDGKYRHILNRERPNIVFLLLESFTANVVKPLGGYGGVTPNLEALAKEGILFSNIYSTGPRSDRGLVAAICALPSNPALALIRYPNKLANYPSFPKDLEKNGYATAYYYAGDINFFSFRSYVTMNFQTIVTENDFSGEAVKNSFKWGIHDQYMFERLYDDISKAPQPFMYMAFNISSHEPYVVPGDVKIQGNDAEHKFMNAIHYSDSCIGNFIDKCKKSGIWDNTLFILMADHGTRVIKHLDPNYPDVYHIPLILTGGVLNLKDTVISDIGSQTDMAATVLAQLDIDRSGYIYSRNLLETSLNPSAFYSYPNGAGLVSDKGTTIFNLKSGEFIEGGDIEENAALLKAYLQIISTKLGK